MKPEISQWVELMTKRAGPRKPALCIAFQPPTGSLPPIAPQLQQRSLRDSTPRQRAGGSGEQNCSVRALGICSALIRSNKVTRALGQKKGVPYRHALSSLATS